MKLNSKYSPVAAIAKQARIHINRSLTAKHSPEAKIPTRKKRANDRLLPRTSKKKKKKKGRGTGSQKWKRGIE